MKHALTIIAAAIERVRERLTGRGRLPGCARSSRPRSPSGDPARPGVENDREVEKTALVKAATFSPELADLTMTAPSIESWRDAQHAHCAPHAGT